MKCMVENQNFAQKSKFCSKIEISVKNQNFAQKSKKPKTVSEIDCLFSKNQNFSKYIFCSKKSKLKC